MRFINLIDLSRLSLATILLLIASTPATAGLSLTDITEFDECRDGIDGLPITSLEGIFCSLEQTLTDWDGQALIDLTRGIVKDITVKGRIQWLTQSKADFDQQTGQTDKILLVIPPQSLALQASLVDSPPLDFELELGAAITVSGHDLCSLHLERIAIQISRLDSSFADWIDHELAQWLMEDESINETLHQSVQDALQELKTESCPRSNPQTKRSLFRDQEQRLSLLADKYKDYLYWSEAQLDEQAWPLDTHCDSLLFVSLYSLAGGRSQPALAEDQSRAGRMFRHWQQDCYANHKAQRPNSSKSTISRDMMMGFSLWMAMTEQSDLLSRVIRFGESQSMQGMPLVWLLGEGQLGRTDLSPALIQSLYQTEAYLRGDHSHIPALFNAFDFQFWPSCEGYACHLQALHLILKRQIAAPIQPQAISAALRLAETEPNNALFQYVAAQYSGEHDRIEQALDTLLNPQWFPIDQLPSSQQRCSFYLFERSYFDDFQRVSKNWQPCPERDEVFSGIDFLLVAKLILNEYGGL